MPQGDENKLFPLRKFAVEGQYSSAYLSLLVNRGRLKAKRIGRNYFTSKKWFDEYLEKYAREEKLKIGFVKAIDLNPVDFRSGFFITKKFKFFYIATIIFVGFLLVNFLANIMIGILFPESGGVVVSGNDEVISAISTEIKSK